MSKYPIGTISHGTMRDQDLLESFANELEYLAKINNVLPNYIELINESNRYAEFLREYENQLWKPHHVKIRNSILDTISFIINEDLFDALNSFAAPYMYFGSHVGDGSDYGFWIMENIEYDFDGLKVSDTSEVPEDYTGEVLHVNDHGNMTLYTSENGKLTEVWGVV
jgi:hypothetical protein